MPMVFPLLSTDLVWLKRVLANSEGMNVPDVQRIEKIIGNLEGEVHDKTITKDPIRNNFNPNRKEMFIRFAVHVLSDAIDEPIVVKFDKDIGVYLIASILDKNSTDDEKKKPNGTIEYQVSDGLPDHRSISVDFYQLEESLKFFEEVVKLGGWRQYNAKMISVS